MQKNCHKVLDMVDFFSFLKLLLQLISKCKMLVDSCPSWWSFVEPHFLCTNKIQSKELKLLKIWRKLFVSHAFGLLSTFAPFVTSWMWTFKEDGWKNCSLDIFEMITNKGVCK